MHIVGEVFHPSSDPTLYGSTQTLPGLATPANVLQWDVAPWPGTSTSRYVKAVNDALGTASPWGATTQKDGGKFYTVAIGLVGLLALMVAIAAGLGVLNTVLMTTRDRFHDLGIFKALGMRPGQMLDHGGVLGGRPGGAGRGDRGARRDGAEHGHRARHGRYRAHRDPGQRHPGVPAVPAGAALAGRAGHRGDRRTGPGELGGRARPAVALRTE